MKAHMKVLSLIILVCLSQSVCADIRKKYINFGYGSSTFIQNGNPDIKSQISASFSVGRTYALHKRPIKNVLLFGLDATWLNCVYSNYKVEHLSWENITYKNNYHIPYIGMQLGPSISILPFKGAMLHGYFRYSPSLIAVIEENDGESPYLSYGSLFNTGVVFNYKVIGVGVDYTFGKSKLPFLGFMSNSGFGSNKLSDIKSIKVVLSFKF